MSYIIIIVAFPPVPEPDPEIKEAIPMLLELLEDTSTVPLLEEPVIDVPLPNAITVELVLFIGKEKLKELDVLPAVVEKTTVILAVIKLPIFE